jgi:hypothetical protein
VFTNRGARTSLRPQFQQHKDVDSSAPRPTLLEDLVHSSIAQFSNTFSKEWFYSA